MSVFFSQLETWNKPEPAVFQVISWLMTCSTFTAGFTWTYTTQLQLQWLQQDCCSVWLWFVFTSHQALCVFFFFFFFRDVRFRSPACWRSAEVPLTEQTLSVHAAARMWREIKAGRLEIKDGALTDTEHVEFCFSASGVSSLSFLNTFYKKRSLLARCFNSRLTS